MLLKDEETVSTRGYVDPSEMVYRLESSFNEYILSHEAISKPKFLESFKNPIYMHISLPIIGAC